MVSQTLSLEHLAPYTPVAWVYYPSLSKFQEGLYAICDFQDCRQEPSFEIYLGNLPSDSFFVACTDHKRQLAKNMHRGRYL